jgi:hypothetical protein
MRNDPDVRYRVWHHGFHATQKTADAPFPTALFVVMPFFWLIMMGGFATLLTLGIICCLKAMRGEWAGFPLISR